MELSGPDPVKVQSWSQRINHQLSILMMSSNPRVAKWWQHEGGTVQVSHNVVTPPPPEKSVSDIRIGYWELNNIWSIGYWFQKGHRHHGYISMYFMYSCTNTCHIHINIYMHMMHIFLHPSMCIYIYWSIDIVSQFPLIGEFNLKKTNDFFWKGFETKQHQVSLVSSCLWFVEEADSFFL